MNKNKLIKLLNEGKTHREIGEILGKSKSTVGYWISKYKINNLSASKMIEYKDKYFFEKIDTKAKAYILGFTLGDAYINSKHLEYSIAKQDKVILDYISEHLGGEVRVDNTLDKKTRRFPRARVHYYNRVLIKHLIKQSGGEYKEDRRIPIVPKHLRRYLLLGFFDADGTITWGYRKDRGRLWHKVAFTSQYKLLEGIQDILYDEINIPTKIRPKSQGDCYVLEFSNKKAVEIFLEYIYDDLIVLERKYRNASNLRLNWENSGKAVKC